MTLTFPYLVRDTKTGEFLGTVQEPYEVAVPAYKGVAYWYPDPLSEDYERLVCHHRHESPEVAKVCATDMLRMAALRHRNGLDGVTLCANCDRAIERYEPSITGWRHTWDGVDHRAPVWCGRGFDGLRAEPKS